MLPILLLSAGLSSPPPISPIRRAAAQATNALRPARRASGVAFPRWFLEYADLRPFDETNIESQLFLATNIAFFACGSYTASIGSPEAVTLGVLCEFAGTASCWYHYAQVTQPKQQPFDGISHPSVQIALVVDYFFALTTLVGGLLYAADLGPDLPIEAVACGAAGVAALATGWFFDKPREYMLFHGAWHVFSAAAGYEIAVAHAARVVGG